MPILLTLLSNQFHVEKWGSSKNLRISRHTKHILFTYHGYKLERLKLFNHLPQLTSSKPASDTVFSSKDNSSKPANPAEALAAATAPTRFIWLPHKSMTRSAGACMCAYVCMSVCVCAYVCVCQHLNMHPLLLRHASSICHIKSTTHSTGTFSSHN